MPKTTVPPPVRPTNTDRAVSVAKQLRRIERKLPLQEQWNRAIARWERKEP
jgi:hypothetical protein